MDTRELRMHAPKTCAAFDRWMDNAGFPDWKIGAEEFERFFENRPAENGETAGILVLAQAVEEVVGRFTDDFRSAIENDKWTPATEAHKCQLFRTSNALLRRIWQQDRLGIWQ